MKQLNLGDSVTCYDFGRIYCKFIKELNIKELKAIYKLHGSNFGHASIEFQSVNASVNLEPILIEGAKQANDLMNTKVGAIPDGIDITFDKEDALRNHLAELYTLAIGEVPTSLSYRLLELKTLSENQEPSQIQFEDKLKAFVTTMKEKDIRGNEAIQLLINYNKYGFFDDKLKIALCAEKSEGQKRWFKVY